MTAGFVTVAAQALAEKAGLSEGTAHEAIRRVLSPDFARWEQQVTRTGHCSRPVRLRGHTITGPGTGAVGYSTFGEPDGQLLIRCGNRRASVCGSCSAEYKGDVWHLLAAGTGGGIKGVPASVGAHPMVFATLTAPSFGPVHRTGDEGRGGLAKRCRPVSETTTCAHHRDRGCERTHAADDPMVGEPLCEDCYDYPAAAAFNWHAPELWRRFTIALRRALAARVGITETAFTRRARLSYAKVAEFQRRGVVHFHAIIRLDGPETDYAEPTIDLAEADLAAGVITAAAGVAITVPVDADRIIALGFGSQVDARPVRARDEDLAGELDPGMVAAYIAKYSVKAAEDFGLTHRVHSQAHAMQVGLRPHVAQMIGSAEQLAGLDGYDGICRWLHMLAFRGHFASKSRHFSVTLGSLRQARHDWRLGIREDDTGAADDPVESTLVVGEWEFLGLGYLTSGDAALAASIAAQAREARAMREDLRGMS